MSANLDELRTAAEAARRVESAAGEAVARAHEVLTAARGEYDRAHNEYTAAHAAACAAELEVRREETRPGPPCPELGSLFAAHVWPHRVPQAGDVVTVAETSDVRGKHEVRLWRWRVNGWAWSRVVVSPAGVPHGYRKALVDPEVLAECVERCARAREACG